MVYVLIVYAKGYVSASETLSPAVGALIPSNLIRAANDGHPFMLYSQRDPSHLVRLDQFANGYYDPGPFVLVSATSLAGRTIFGDQFQVNEQTIFRIFFAIFVLTGLIFCCPAIPLPISVGGLAAMASSILVGGGIVPAFSTWLYWWWSAYSAILVAMLVSAIFCARPGPWQVVFFGGLTLLISSSQFFRNEATITTYAAMASVISTLLGVWIVARWGLRLPRVAAECELLIKRAAMYGGIVIVGLVAAPYMLREIYALTWRVPFSETSISLHGAGHSLYLSLGYAANSYGISWRDNIAMSYSHLIDPTVRFDDRRYHEVLVAESLRVILESPWLLLSNVWLKANAVRVAFVASAPLTTLSGLAAIAGGVSTVVAFNRRSPSLLALFAGFIGVSSGASASALIIHPLYLYGVQALVMLAAFWLPAVVFVLVRSEANRAKNSPTSSNIIDVRCVTNRTLGIISAIGILVGVAGISWYSWRVATYQQELASIVTSSNPLADILRQGYRYSHFFNDLPTLEQERVIAMLNTTNDSHVAVPTPSSSIEGFRPVAMVSTPYQLHVIAWLGSEQPLSESPSESAIGFIGYCVECQEIRQDLPNDPYFLSDDNIRFDVAGIHNQSWADKYQMLSIPTQSPELPDGEIRLALQTVIDQDSTTFTYNLRTVGNWVARFPQ